MGVNYTLFRLHRAVGDDGESIELLEELTKGLTFGSVKKVQKRLLESKVYGVDLVSSDVEEGVSELKEGDLSASPLSLEIPKHWSVQVHADDGRFIDMTFWGDPVEKIRFRKPSPRDLLPIVDAFPELSPFGIWCETDDRVYDPDKYRPSSPADSLDQVVSLLPLSRAPFPDKTGLRWAIQTSAHLNTQSPVTALDDRVFLSASDSIACLELPTGSVVWTRQWSTGAMLVTPTPSAVVVAGDAPSVYGLACDSGETLWSVDVKGRVTAPPTRTGEDAVAFGTEGGCLYNVECSTGRVLWWADWVPGPVYTRLAFSGSEVIATATDDDLGVVYACANPPGQTPAATHYVEGRMENEKSYEVPSMLQVAAVGRSVFLLGTSFNLLIRLSLPDLGDPTTVDDCTGRTMFEPFMTPLNDELLAYAVSTKRNEGALRVVDSETLSRLHEIPLSQTAADAVVLDERRFAVVLRPSREDRSSQAKVLIIEIATGNVLREIPLGFRGWQSAYIATHGNSLLTGSANGQGADSWVVGCWDTE